MGVGGKRHSPASLPTEKTRYPFYRRLGGPQYRSERVRKIFPAPGFDTRTVLPVASSYTDCPIAAHYCFIAFIKLLWRISYLIWLTWFQTISHPKQMSESNRTEFIHKLWAVDKKGYCTCCWSWTKTVYCRGPERMLYLQVVDENGYDLFPLEEYKINRGRKRICLTTRPLAIAPPPKSRSTAENKQFAVTRGSVIASDLPFSVITASHWRDYEKESDVIYLGKADKFVGSDAKNFVACHSEF
jgi:hypothetical protein